MIRPMIKIHNVTTSEIVEREMNDDEFAQLQIDIANEQTRQAEAESRAQAKAELLERLGITADEAKLLLA
jgi:hypothetical protein